MSRYRTIIVAALFILLLQMVTGCSSTPESSSKLAYIKVNKQSPYEQTFKDLHLGPLLDFNLRLPEADQTWVNIWVEGYQDGKPMSPLKLAELSYGESPEPTAEGPLVMGIVNAAAGKPLIFLYSSGASVVPQALDFVLNREGVGGSTWSYAFGDEEVGFEAGETKVLGVYREVKKILNSYDYQDTEQLKQMVKDDMTVLFLKIKVEHQPSP